MTRDTESGNETRAVFECCDGPTRVLDETTIEHACRLKYANVTSYYDGIERYARWERIEIRDTGRYNWWASWD